MSGAEADMKKNTLRAPSPKKEAILEEIAIFIAEYKKSPEDPRNKSAIADSFFDYLNEKMDKYCS